MLNKVIIQGRLVKDPEIRQTQSGVSCAIFCLAVDRDYVPKGQEKQADFINCIAWRQTADFVGKTFQKGRMMIVEGSLQTRSYTDKNGSNRTITEVMVSNVYFSDSKPTASQNVQGARNQSKANNTNTNQNSQQQPHNAQYSQENLPPVDDFSDDLPY